ncbi:STM4015 family protein [Nocardiopsis sp. NPDC058631]|uniref:STM4015 family protein n=1 Tax=Nocardiopsis sp. NPDC058631 TaxID=3346566 RepID=UPI0036657E13
MPNHSHLTEFAGLPVVEFPALDTVDHEYQRMVHRGEPVPDPYPPHAALAAGSAAPGSVAWRLRTEEPVRYSRPGWSSRLEDTAAYVTRFAEEVDLSAVTALIVGNMAGDVEAVPSDEVRDRLLGIAPRLTGLRSLFFAEVVQEENEISWIEHGDLAPLLAAFPDLVGFTVRGGSAGPGLRIAEHRALRSLTVQSGALRPEVVRDVGASSLPNLERLELWLGAKEYGGESTPEDLAPVLSGTAFPGLRHLGLRNTEDLDGWVPALAGAPLVAALDTLDLSLGTLTDEGARVLLDAPVFRGLGRLDLHHHYLSEEMAERVRAEFTASGVEVDVSAPQEAEVDEYDGETHVHRYTAVSE